MPITQDRMIALIAAARDCQQALQSAERLVNEAYERCHAGADAGAEIAKLRVMIRMGTLMNDPINHTALLVIEEKHFRQNRRENDRKKRQARDKRGVPNHIVARTAPISLIESMKKTPLQKIDEATETAIAAAAIKDGFTSISPERQAEIQRMVEAEVEIDRLGDDTSGHIGLSDGDDDTV